MIFASFSVLEEPAGIKKYLCDFGIIKYNYRRLTPMGWRVDLRDLKRLQKQLCGEICDRLKEFERIGKNSSQSEVFAELVFCILTPQSDAHLCWEAVGLLGDCNLLMKGSASRIAPLLRGRSRFHHTKAKNIVLAVE